MKLEENKCLFWRKEEFCFFEENKILFLEENGYARYSRCSQQIEILAKSLWRILTYIPTNTPLNMSLFIFVRLLTQRLHLNGVV